MRFILLYLTVFAALSLSAQQQTEFEGVIRYKHLFTFNSSVTDTASIKERFGSSSVFYYKKGSYKWIYRSDMDIVTEYFDGETQTLYLQSRWTGDTLFKAKGHGYTLQSFQLYDVTDTICGIKCKKAKTITFEKGGGGDFFERTIYYSPEVYVPPTRFSAYNLYATSLVIKKTKSWPLRIEIKAQKRAFAETFEAIEVVPQELSDSEVHFPKDKPVKPLPLF